MRSSQLIIDQLVADLAEFQSRLETVNSTLTSTPYIVCSPDCFYTVGLKEDGVTCTVKMGDSSPTMFDRANALHIVNGFKASNGNGPIEWMMLSEEEFLRILIDDFKTTIDFSIQSSPMLPNRRD